MSAASPIQIAERTQKSAAHPAKSVWVSASAGSGTSWARLRQGDARAAITAMKDLMNWLPTRATTPPVTISLVWILGKTARSLPHPLNLLVAMRTKRTAFRPVRRGLEDANGGSKQETTHTAGRPWHARRCDKSVGAWR